jgi:hypothetical protein
MYTTRTRHSSRWEKLMCQWFGHEMVEGLKYHTATKRGCSKVCQRCGFYDVLEEDVGNLPSSSVSLTQPSKT